MAETGPGFRGCNPIVGTALSTDAFSAMATRHPDVKIDAYDLRQGGKVRRRDAPGQSVRPAAGRAGGPATFPARSLLVDDTNPIFAIDRIDSRLRGEFFPAV